MSAEEQNDKVAQWITENAPEWIVDGGAGDVAIRILEDWKRSKEPHLTLACPVCGEDAVKSFVGGAYQCNNGHKYVGPDTACTFCDWAGFYEDFGDHMADVHGGDLKMPDGAYWVMISGSGGEGRVTCSASVSGLGHLQQILGGTMHSIAARSVSTSNREDAVVEGL